LVRVLSDQRCLVTDGTLSGDQAELRGVAGPGIEARFRQVLLAGSVPVRLDWRAAEAGAVFCPALDAIRPAAPGFRPELPRLVLTLADGRALLRDGEAIRPRVIMPSFPAYLRLDYIAHDGTVQHLYPQVEEAAQGIRADPPRRFAPSEWVNLGDPEPGQRGWEASAPYGRDLMIAVATSVPLLARPRTANAEAADAYLRAVAEALDDLLASGGTAAASALVVDITGR
jgi:hypothetical protein